jgi:hypothetical protein
MEIQLQCVTPTLAIWLASPGAVAAPTQNPQVLPVVSSAFRQRDDVIHRQIL